MRRFLVCMIVFGFLISSALGARQERSPRVPSGEILESLKKLQADQGYMAMLKGELPPALQAKGEDFAGAYPRLYRMVNKGRIPFAAFDVALKGWLHNDSDILETLRAFEAGDTIRKFLKRIAEYNINPQSCHDCQRLTDLYVQGCRDGGGDMWFCFLRGEMYLCYCENTLCDFPYRDCGFWLM